ncbi:MAG: hypothetical protein GY953_23615 [bacterium]|nr:hypothetical protein [bacterium]
MTKTASVYPGLVLALLTIAAPEAHPQEDWSAPARRLVREILSGGSSPDAVRLATRNRITGAQPDLEALGDAVAEALMARGVDRPADATESVAELMVTLTSNTRGLLLVGRMRGAEHEAVAIVELERLPGPRTTTPPVTIRATRLIDQREPILDVAFTADGLLVLSPAALRHYARDEEGWALDSTDSLDVTVRVRDPRGRLQVRGDSLNVWLPGTICTGSVGSMPRCRLEQADWPFPLDGVQLLDGRNWFTHPDLPPFFSLARLGSQWVATHRDGATVLYDEDFRPVRTYDGLGSDIASLESACGEPVLLVTSPTDSGERGTVRVYGTESPALDLPGPVVVLGPTVAVARDLGTGRYVAYRIDIDCGR